MNLMNFILFYLATTKTGASDGTRKSSMRAIFEPLLKEDRKEDFFKIWGEWFVLEDTVRDEKTPGKLKSEWQTNNGSIIALCNKMYMCMDNEPASSKRSTKGLI